MIFTESPVTASYYLKSYTGKAWDLYFNKSFAFFPLDNHGRPSVTGSFTGQFWWPMPSKMPEHTDMIDVINYYTGHKIRIETNDYAIAELKETVNL